jgi:hypothetical protein
MTTEMTARLLETLARSIRQRQLPPEEAAKRLEREADLMRKTEAEEREHARTCPECVLPEPIEVVLPLTA